MGFELLIETIVDEGKIETVVADEFGCRKECLPGAAFNQGREGTRYRWHESGFDNLELRRDVVVDDNPDAGLRLPFGNPPSGRKESIRQD